MKNSTPAETVKVMAELTIKIKALEAEIKAGQTKPKGP